MAWQQYAGVELNYREAELIRQICLERKAYEFKRQQAEIEYMRTESLRGNPWLMQLISSSELEQTG